METPCCFNTKCYLKLVDNQEELLLIISCRAKCARLTCVRMWSLWAKVQQANETHNRNFMINYHPVTTEAFKDRPHHQQ